MGWSSLALAEAEDDLETAQAVAVHVEEIAAELEKREVCAGSQRPARPRKINAGYPRGRRRH